MARRTNLRLVTPTTHVAVTEYTAEWRNPRHPAGAFPFRPSVRDGDRIAALEGALIRVAEFCKDRPHAMAIIAGALFDDPDPTDNARR